MLATLLIAALILLISACGSSGSNQATSDIVSEIPWVQNEALTYVLHDNAGRQTGTGTLTIKVNGSETELSQEYSSGSGTSDNSTVVVDSQTLKPTSARRVITGTKDDQDIEVSYTEQGALIKQGKKQSGLSVPEHSYDNDSSLFLWRTIDFSEGYSARYTTIITNRRSRQSVDLKVTGHDSVTVPAGQFNAWRLEIKTENANQVAWFADTPARTLVKYDNDDGTIFELQTKP